MKIKNKTNDNKNIREHSTKELLRNLLPIGNDVLTKREYTLLEEVEGFLLSKGLKWGVKV